MKTQKIMAIMGVAISVLAGLLVASGISGTPLVVLGADNTPMGGEKAGIWGHIVLKAYDSEGNLKQYVQTDNTITDELENCLLEALFGITSTGCGDSAGGTTVFDDVAIGTGSTGSFETNVALVAETHRTSATPGSTDASSGSAAEAVIAATLTATAVENIRESGLFDSSTSGLGSMFARQTFGTVALNTGDTLSVTWTITLGA